MTETKSPSAVAALGSSLSDRLGRQLAAENNRQEGFAQAPICAELIGSDRCEAEGITACGYAPVLQLCRELVAAGFNPACPLEAWRGETLCLRIRYGRRGSPSPMIGTALHGFDAARTARQGMSQARLSRKLRTAQQEQPATGETVQCPKVASRRASRARHLRKPTTAPNCNRRIGQHLPRRSGAVAALAATF